MSPAFNHKCLGLYTFQLQQTSNGSTSLEETGNSNHATHKATVATDELFVTSNHDNPDHPDRRYSTVSFAEDVTVIPMNGHEAPDISSRPDIGSSGRKSLTHSYASSHSSECLDSGEELRWWHSLSSKQRRRSSRWSIIQLQVSEIYLGRSQRCIFFLF